VDSGGDPDQPAVIVPRVLQGCSCPVAYKKQERRSSVPKKGASLVFPQRSSAGRPVEISGPSWRSRQNYSGDVRSTACVHKHAQVPLLNLKAFSPLSQTIERFAEPSYLDNGANFNSTETAAKTPEVATPRAARIAAAKALIEQLAERFPGFSIHEKRRLPLKLGIHNDIIATLGDAVSLRNLKIALHYYTSNFGYLRNIREGAPRVDLDGNSAGEVTASEAEHARQRLEQYAKRRATTVINKPEQAPVAAAPAPPPGRISLSDLKTAAAARRQKQNPMAVT
jgi:sRNA-binding protein